MANSIESIDNNILESRILKIVEKITKQRNRPGYRNIHTFLMRGNFSIDDNELRLFIDGLLERGILINVGIAEKESFRVAPVPSAKDDSLPTIDEINKNDDILITSEKMSTNENMSTDDNSALNNFINHKFYEILTERIKCEVIKCVELKLCNYPISNIPIEVNDSAEVIQCKDNDLIINQLNKEVEYLRTELKSKDTIIELLTKCKDNNNNTNHMNVTESTVHVTDKQNVITKSKNKCAERVVRNSEKGDISVTLNLCDNEEIITEDDNTNFTEITYKSNTKKDTRTITILGDSIVKDLQPHKMKRRLGRNEKLFVKSFSGANVADMVDYARPTVRKESDLIVLHAGTNDLRSSKTPENIASDIMKLALEIKSANNEVILSSILFRDDNPELNEKGNATNTILKSECQFYNILFIDNSNIQKQHLNGSKLHLNYKGTVALAANLLDYVKI